MDGLQRSNVVFAKILQLAKEHGVSHWSLSFDALQLDDEFRTFFFPCVEWLEAEGLIRVGSYARTLGGYAEGSISNISLTARGMAVLGQKIVLSGEEMTLSEEVRRVSAGEKSYSGIGDFIGGILGGFTKSIGS